MSAPLYCIGIDIGISATKTVLGDLDGHLIVEFSREYPLYQPHNGWAEQDPCDWWSATAETLREVTAAVDPAAIVGVGFSGQMYGLVMLDGQGEVIRPAIIWCDSRTATECAEINALVGVETLWS